MAFSTNRMVDCPTDEVLSAYIKRTLPEQNREAVSRHLFLCNTCLEYAKLLLWDSDYEPSDDDLNSAQLNQPVEVTPVIADVLERFKGFREHRRNFPAKTLRELGIDGLRIGQVWRTRVEDIAVPTMNEEERASASELNSNPHLVLITNPNVETRRIGARTYHVVRVLPIDTDIDYAGEGDLVMDRDESPLGYSFMAQLWNEQEMLQENLDSCLGELNDKNHPAIWKSLDRQGRRPLAPGAFSLENIIINGLFYDPFFRYRAKEYEETQYLRVPVESLREAISQYPVESKRPIAERLWAWLHIPNFQFVPVGVGVAIALLIAAVPTVLVWRSMRNQVITRESRIAQLQQEKNALEKTASKTQELEAQLQALKNKESTQQIAINNRDFVHLPSLGASPPAKRSPQMAINDGGRRIGLDKEKRVTGLEGSPASIQEVAQEALEGRIGVPSDLRSRLLNEDSANTQTRGVGGDETVAKSPLVYPAGTVVRSNQPTFRWQPVPGAKGYVVRLFTSDFRPIESSELLTGTQWTPKQALSNDAKYYRWQVDAITSDERHPIEFKSRFIVLDEAKKQGLEAAESQYVNSHLVLGSLYMKSGLFDEAEEQFRLLLKENPHSSVAKKLLQQVQRSRTRR
jgi:hypothetical protein